MLPPSLLAAYFTPCLFEQGSTLTMQEKLPPLAFYPASAADGEVVLGHQVSPETAQLTQVPLRLSRARHFHTAFCGDTGYGKSVAAERLAYETTRQWGLRTLVLDFGTGWRKMLNAPGLEGKVEIRQLWPQGPRPLRWNPLQIGRRVPPELHWRTFCDIFGQIGQLGEKRQIHELRNVLGQVYREHGVNPFGGCFPLLIQFPILIGLYQAIIFTLAATPFQLLDLSGRFLLPGLDHLVPLENLWLGMDLSQPPTNNPTWALALPVLVLVTTWAQSKLTVTPTPQTGSDGRPSQAQAMTQSMTTIMPLMFGFFSLSFSVGLSIYFVISNIIGIIQYSLMGQSKLDMRKLLRRGAPAVAIDRADTPPPAQVAPRSESRRRRAAEGGKSKRRTKSRNR